MLGELEKLLLAAGLSDLAQKVAVWDVATIIATVQQRKAMNSQIADWYARWEEIWEDVWNARQ